MIPTGGGENDYQMVFTFGGNQYFTQLAVEQTGTVLAWDGELVRVSLENKYLQEHVGHRHDHAGPERHRRGRRADLGLPGPGRRRDAPASVSAATYVREGVNQGPLEPVDSAGPTYDDVAGSVHVMKKLARRSPRSR